MVSQTPLKDQGILRGLYKAVHLHQLILERMKILVSRFICSIKVKCFMRKFNNAKRFQNLSNFTFSQDYDLMCIVSDHFEG